MNNYSVQEIVIPISCGWQWVDVLGRELMAEETRKKNGRE